MVSLDKKVISINARWYDFIQEWYHLECQCDINYFQSNLT